MDVQQTRAIQYQQALHALTRARELCQLPELSIDNADEWLDTFEAREQQATQTLLALEQKISVADAAHSQFEQAYQLVKNMIGEVSRSDAYQQARTLLRDWSSQQHLAERVQPLRMQLSELQQRLNSQQNAERMLAEFCKRHGQSYEPDELDALMAELEAQQEELSVGVNESGERRMQMRQELEQIRLRISQLSSKAPAWIMAQEALTQLNEQSHETFESSTAVTEFMQQLLEQEREITVERDEVAAQRKDLEKQIERLSQPSGAEDGRMLALAERFNGVLLSEIYDDITIEDAAYFSALYGPARHGIVVQDLSVVRSQLETLQDCPDDVYFIEGDPQSFDDSVFDAQEFESAVLVRSSERQWRYSRYPELPLFGRAARESHLESLTAERDELAERYANLSFDVQKIQRSHQAFSRFIGQHISVAFEDDPEAEIRTLNQKRSEIERALVQFEEQTQQQHQQFAQGKESLAALNRLLPQMGLLLDETLVDRVEEISEELTEAEEAAHFLNKHGHALEKLEPIVTVLLSDPEQHEQLRKDYEAAKHSQQNAKQQAFALVEVVQRRAHFSYSDSTGMVNENADLNEKLRQRLEQAETERTRAREQLRQHQAQSAQFHQVLASLRSSFDTKQEMLKELEVEMQEIGVKADPDAQERARIRRDELHQRVMENRSRINQLEKQLTLCEAEMDNLQKRLRKLEKTTICCVSR